MKSEYYCKHCEAYFSDAMQPNINKYHYCGKLAKLVQFQEEEQEGEEAR